MSNLHALEQMTAAVDCLYLPNDPLRERVALAFSLLRTINIVEDVPLPLRARFQQLMERFFSPNVDSPVLATARMGPSECTVFTKELMLLTDELRRQLRPS